MDSDVCSITGICAHLRDVAVKRRWLQAEPLFETGSLDMVITSSSQGNWTEVEITATYKEEGLITDMPIFLSVQAGVPVTCTRRANTARTVFTCIGAYVPQSKMVFTAMAPNVAVNGAVVSSSVTHTGEQMVHFDSLQCHSLMDCIAVGSTINW
jgi:hypothetical protein